MLSIPASRCDPHTATLAAQWWAGSSLVPPSVARGTRRPGFQSMRTSNHYQETCVISHIAQALHPPLPVTARVNPRIRSKATSSSPTRPPQCRRRCARICAPPRRSLPSAAPSDAIALAQHSVFRCACQRPRLSPPVLGSPADTSARCAPASRSVRLRRTSSGLQNLGGQTLFPAPGKRKNV